MTGTDHRDSEYEAIRQRAEQRVRARQEFMQHLAIYVVVNFFLWMLWYVVKQMFLSVALFAFPWPVVITFGWAIGLSAHALDTYFKSSMAAARREMAIEREVQREMAMRGMSYDKDKHKRDRVVRLSDDGELVTDDEDTGAVRMEQKHG
jgi:hypothetical protein